MLHTLSRIPRELNFIEHTSDIGWKEYATHIISPFFFLFFANQSSETIHKKRSIILVVMLVLSYVFFVVVVVVVLGTKEPSLL